jgi:putative transposase
VDTIGLIVAVVVHAADVRDADGAKLLFESIRGRFSRLKLVWADGAYRRVADRVAAWRPAWPIRPEVVEKAASGFVVLPRRWVVERTFAWLCHNRRMSKDYERLCATGEAFVYVAMTRLMVRRLARA